VVPYVERNETSSYADDGCPREGFVRSVLEKESAVKSEHIVDVFIIPPQNAYMYMAQICVLTTLLWRLVISKKQKTRKSFIGLNV